MKRKNSISNISIYDFYPKTIDKDTFTSLSEISYFNIRINKEKEYIYLLTNDESKLILNNILMNQIKSNYNFYQIKNNTYLDLITDIYHLIFLN